MRIFVSGCILKDDIYSSEGNAGIAIVYEEGLVKAKNIDKATNNVVKYQAIIFALEEAKGKYSHVEIISDSELVVNQINGNNKINTPNLIELFNKITELSEKFDYLKFTYLKEVVFDEQFKASETAKEYAKKLPEI